MPATSVSTAYNSGALAAVTPRRTGAWRRGWDRPRIAVAFAAIVSGVLAAVLSTTVFAHLSVNNDEPVYLLQARAMAAGHLFPPAAHPASSFTPWLGVIRDGHYVLKYTPVVPAFLALSLLLTGGYVAALVCWAMALVGVTYLLAREVTGGRGTAATAAVLATCSPLIVVQSALALPYLPSVVLIELTLWGFVAGARRNSLRLLAFGGLCAGIDFAARPFDTPLTLAPIVGWLLWRTRHRRLRTAGGMLAGAAIPLAGLLWFDRVATGSPLRLTFSLFERSDAIGWGVRRLYPGDAPRHFGIEQAWQGLSEHLRLLGAGWAFGGVLLAGLVVVALARHRASAASICILAGGLLLTLGYLCFWGPWNAAVLWGGVRYVGPFYLMPLLVPLCILGAVGLREIAAAGTWKVALIVAASAAISAVTLASALTADAAFGSDDAALANAISARGRSIVFVDVVPGYLQHPAAVVSNAYPPGGRTVYALQRGRDDFAVMHAFPGRQLYRLRLSGAYGRRPHTGYGARLERLKLLSGRTLKLHVAATLPPFSASARLIISVGAKHVSWALRQHPSNHVDLSLSAAARAARPLARDSLLTISPNDGLVTVTLVARKPGGRDRMVDRVRLPVTARSDGRLSVLAPAGVVARQGPLAGPALSLEVVTR